MNIFRLTAVAVSLTLFSACGGGGGGGGAGGGGGGGGIALEPLPGLLVADASRARGLVGVGATALNMTSDGIDEALGERSGAANTLQLSHIDTVLNLDSFGRFDVSQFTEFTEFTGTNIRDFTGFQDEHSAVMIDRGVTFVQTRAAGRLDGRRHQLQSYTGWLDHNVFGVQVETGTGGMNITSYSFGTESEGNPTVTTARWEGAMVGRGTETGAIVHGGAGIDVDFSALSVDVQFTDIMNLDGGDNPENITWSGIGLMGGEFSSDDKSIRGVFYGTDHGEVGGIFNRDNIVGAFGAER